MAFSKRPLSRAEKVERSPSLQCSNCIAAIDFGTSSVSLAYTTPLNKGDIQILKLHRTYDRVSNAILIARNETTAECKVKEIGQIAQESYFNLEGIEHKKHVYFERIKMILERDKDINRESIVPSLTGGNYYLLEVIAFIISHLKDKLLSHLSHKYKCSDFDWVITVPAIWKARARRMMREAAYLAGLTCDNGGITNFTDTSRGTLPRPLEVNPHKLTLALEPEAAAIYANLYPQLSGRPHIPPERYMVVDIGGGTVDITAHQRRKEKIKVLLPPIGNTWGGTTINKALRIMIEELVKDKGHEKFLESDKTARADLNHLYYQVFEEQKKQFSDQYSPTTREREELKITLPTPFVTFYHRDKLYDYSQRLGMRFINRNNALCIKYKLLEEKVFQLTVEGIVTVVREALEKLKGSSYVKHSLQEALAEEKGKVFDHIICPQQADLAVTIGAVMWRQAPDIIQSRIADATYGMCVCPLYNFIIHDKHYRYTDKEDGRDRCNNVFEVFVLKGEVTSSEVYKTILYPRTQTQTTMTLSIYSTIDHGVQYTVDKEGESTVHRIGELIVDMPNPKDAPRYKRSVDVFFDFRGTEIQASAKYSLTGEEVKTACDFLSYQD